jgi:hypothetical protein
MAKQGCYHCYCITKPLAGADLLLHGKQGEGALLSQLSHQAHCCSCIHGKPGCVVVLVAWSIVPACRAGWSTNNGSDFAFRARLMVKYQDEGYWVLTSLVTESRSFKEPLLGGAFHS